MKLFLVLVVLIAIVAVNEAKSLQIDQDEERFLEVEPAERVHLAKGTDCITRQFE